MVSATTNIERSVCVVSPSRDAYSETFIRAHVELLPAKVTAMYGTFPDYGQSEVSITPSPTLWRHAKQAVERRILGITADEQLDHPLKQFLQKRKIDSVLAEYGPTGLPIIGPCREMDIPLVVHFHGYDAYRSDVLDLVGHHYQELFDSSASIIAVSRHMESQLLSLGAPRRKLHYNPCGVDTTLFRGGDPSHAPPTFISVGRFVDKKAPYLTLRAFQSVVEAVPESRLVMIGDGPLLETCQNLSRVFEIADKVDFQGQSPHPTVASTMRAARAFVQHSVRSRIGDSEGTPVAVLEAGASGLPVVATRHGGIPDVVIDGETGLLVDEWDVDGMAEHMVQLARDPALASRLGQNAKARIRREFPVEKSIENLWRIIEANIH